MNTTHYHCRHHLLTNIMALIDLSQSQVQLLVNWKVGAENVRFHVIHRRKKSYTSSNFGKIAKTTTSSTYSPSIHSMYCELSSVSIFTNWKRNSATGCCGISLLLGMMDSIKSFQMRVDVKKDNFSRSCVDGTKHSISVLHQKNKDRYV